MNSTSTVEYKNLFSWDILYTKLSKTNYNTFIKKLIQWSDFTTKAYLIKNQLQFYFNIKKDQESKLKINFFMILVNFSIINIKIIDYNKIIISKLLLLTNYVKKYKLSKYI